MTRDIDAAAWAWLIEPDTAGFLDILDALPAARRDDALYVRCRYDLGLFCAVFFGARLPLPFSRFHQSTLRRVKTTWRDRPRPQRIADAAPRGNAKSTLESFCSLAHDAVYALEAYVGIISTTFSLSEDLVADLHEVFTDADTYADLHRVYGPIHATGSKTDFRVSVGIGEGRTRFKAFSFGGSIRGTKDAGVRPTKIVIDDGEHPDRVRSPTQREKLWNYLTKDILKAGDTGTIFRVIGTVLHPDSMLSRILGPTGEGAPGWQARRWQAVEAWPDRMDLWDRCKRLWADLSDPDREDTARDYYRRHRAEMDRGARVLWPEKEPLYDLMLMLWTDGEASFYSEKQNVATDPARQVFWPERWARCSFDGEVITSSKGRRVHLKSCRVAVWLDPRASEETERNDYAAVTLAAEDRLGYKYLLKTDLRRVGTLGQLDLMWAAFGIIGPAGLYGYEDNGFARLIGTILDDQRKSRRAAGRVWNLPLIGHASTENKNTRMSRLAPLFDLGWIEVAEDMEPIAIEQAREIPTGTHDDGPDSWERAIWLLEGGGSATFDGAASFGG